MVNRYEGSCGQCHGLVKAGAGNAKQYRGRWYVFHPFGQCPGREAAVAAVVERMVPAAPAVMRGVTIISPEGVELGDLHADDTLRPRPGGLLERARQLEARQ